MIFRSVILALILFNGWCAKCNAQEVELNDSLRDVLVQMKQNDQLLRGQIDSVRNNFGAKSNEYTQLWSKINLTDSLNTIELITIIDNFGWPGESLVGTEGTLAAFLLLQHADRHPTAQISYLPMVINAANKGELNWGYVAYLIDRVKLYKENKEQVYGTQLQLNEETGKWEAVRLEDPENVDKRRASVGLFPMEEYLEMYNK